VTRSERGVLSSRPATCRRGRSARERAGTLALEIEDLYVVYDSPTTNLLGRTASGVPAVRGVSILVAPGELVGIVGESGSGKSSIALAVAGVGRVTSGSIRIFGDDRTRPRAGHAGRAARADVQMVFQDPYSSLDPRQTIRSGLAELRHLHPSRTDWITDEDLLGSVGLQASLLQRYPHQLSGGQCQRITIARALLLQPVVLIADEPTSSLDVSVQAQILNLVLDLQSSRHFGVLFISHDLGVVRQVCERVYVLQGGVVVEAGVTEAVFASPSEPYTQRLIASIPGRRAAATGLANIRTSA
jgi:ABC-type glutathione transport system ATPase component